MAHSQDIRLLFDSQDSKLFSLDVPTDIHVFTMLFSLKRKQMDLLRNIQPFSLYCSASFLGWRWSSEASKKVFNVQLSWWMPTVREGSFKYVPPFCFPKLC